MRITSGMMSRRSLRDIEFAYQKLMDASYSYHTGKKHENAYDDPVSANTLNRLKSDKKDLAKYYSNIDNAVASVNDMETALRDIGACTTDIIELCNTANNSTLPKEARQVIAQQIRQLKEQIITDLNYNSAGVYIFAGFNTKNKPITQDKDGNHFYNNMAIENDPAWDDVEKEEHQEKLDMASKQKITVNISKGMTLDIRVSALEISGTGDGNLLENLEKLASIIEAEEVDKDAFADQLDLLNINHDRILMLTTKTGTATNRIASIKAQLESREFTLEGRISDVEDIDLERAILNYKLAETAYNASLQAASTSIQMSLLDFMR